MRGREDPKVSGEVLVRWGDQYGELLQKLDLAESKLGAAVAQGPREFDHRLSLRIYG